MVTCEIWPLAYFADGTERLIDDQTGFEDDFHRLGLDGRQEDFDDVALKFGDRDLERVQTAGVHGRYIAHPKDHNARLAARAAQRHAEHFGGGKKHRPFDAVDDDALEYFLS